MNAIVTPVVNTINKPASTVPAKVIITPPVVANAIPEEPKPSAVSGPLKLPKPLTQADRIPANWTIVETDDVNVVSCMNNVSMRKFTGTRKEFSAFIRED